MEGSEGSFLSVISENMSRKSLTFLDTGLRGTSTPTEVSSWISDVDIVCQQNKILAQLLAEENAGRKRCCCLLLLLQAENADLIAADRCLLLLLQAENAAAALKTLLLLC